MKNSPGGTYRPPCPLPFPTALPLVPVPLVPLLPFFPFPFFFPSPPPSLLSCPPLVPLPPFPLPPLVPLPLVPLPPLVPLQPTLDPQEALVALLSEPFWWSQSQPHLKLHAF